MALRRLILICAMALGLATMAVAQHVRPPSALAGDLCDCIGAIDPAESNHNLDLAFRHCLNSVMVKHSSEVIQLLQRYPVQDRKFYLLGILLGSSLDRSCPEYPLMKERLRQLSEDGQVTAPST